MRFALLGLAALVVASTLSAQVHVRGYTKRDGTYVAPYTRTAPDSTILNNYSTRPNLNPYTGKVGTVDPDGTSHRNAGSSSFGYTQPSSSYGSSNTDSDSEDPE